MISLQEKLGDIVTLYYYLIDNKELTEEQRDTLIKECFESLNLVDKDLI